MEFSVKKSDLLEELTVAQGVVEKKTTIPILANVLIEAAANQVALTATDLELCLRTHCPAKVRRAGAVTVPAKKLLELIRLLPDEEIQFKGQESTWVQVLCDRKSYRLVGLAKENFPALPDQPPSLARIPARMLADLVAKTAFAISNEETRYTLGGALLILRPDGAVAVATDGHRLALVEADHTFTQPALREEVRTLIPRKALVEMQRLAVQEEDAEVELARDASHVFLRFPSGRLLASRLLTGQFPNYEAVLPRENNRILTIDRDELANALRRAAQLADPRSQAVKFSLRPGALEISASSPEYGEANEVIELDYAGDALTMGFNVSYLLDFLGAAAAGPVRIELKDEQSAGQLRPLGEERYRYRYILMPMRI
ncbi:MAG: DNA polymerase III subunit beta [Firmicutes bacterium]|nr:DNA polymerase III subunit beta [Bacillota bacterium]